MVAACACATLGALLLVGCSEQAPNDKPPVIIITDQDADTSPTPDPADAADAADVAEPQDTAPTCGEQDGICPSGCDANHDRDCTPICGNGVIEAGESCDGHCPRTDSDCDDYACKTGHVTGSADDCSASCTYEPITECTTGDGCCPSGCDSSDGDCPLHLTCNGLGANLVASRHVVDSTAMYFDTDGHAHIAYTTDDFNGITYQTNVTGIWREERIPTPADIRYLCGMHAGPDGTIHLIFAGVDTPLFDAIRTAADGWNVEEIGPIGPYPNECDFDIDSTGQVHVAYLGPEGDSFLYRRRLTEGTWEQPIVMPDKEGRPSVAAKPTGAGAELAWRYDDGIDLAQAGGGNVSLTQHLTILNDTMDHMTYDVRLGFDQAGRRLIFYGGRDSSNGDYVAVARWEGPSQPQVHVLSIVGEPRWVELGEDRLSRPIFMWGQHGGEHEYLRDLFFGALQDGRIDYWQANFGDLRLQTLVVGPDALPVALSEEVTTPSLILFNLCSFNLTCHGDCTGRECGSDDCGGLCGQCHNNKTCAGNECLCEPDCKRKDCGNDGCGGSCGYCGAGEVCRPDNTCGPACTPNCSGKSCGDDGCGGSCGTCPSGEVCGNTGQCCQPQCSGKECGDDGCGGSCGNCGATGTCSTSDQCTFQYGECDPIEQVGCPSGSRCAWDEIANSTVCTPNGSVYEGEDCSSATCRAGLQCGRSTYTNICRSLCQTDADCGHNAKCVYDIDYNTSLRLCAFGCDPASTSSYICGSGFACYVFDTTADHQVTDCRAEGSGGPGDTCFKPEDCSAGTTCFNQTCRTTCRIGLTCPNGQLCNRVANWNEYGICPL